MSSMRSESQPRRPYQGYWGSRRQRTRAKLLAAHLQLPWLQGHSHFPSCGCFPSCSNPFADMTSIRSLHPTSGTWVFTLSIRLGTYIAVNASETAFGRILATLLMIASPAAWHPSRVHSGARSCHGILQSGTVKCVHVHAAHAARVECVCAGL
jgi:hypothetical protein